MYESGVVIARVADDDTGELEFLCDGDDELMIFDDDDTAIEILSQHLTADEMEALIFIDYDEFLSGWEE